MRPNPLLCAGSGSGSGSGSGKATGANQKLRAELSWAGTFIAALGASILEDMDFNSITVPRQAQAAVGAICRLARADGSEATTLNVEYNQLDPLLRATVNPEGDVPGKNGLSPYPGNTNQLVVKLSAYGEPNAWCPLTTSTGSLFRKRPLATVG